MKRLKKTKLSLLIITFLSVNNFAQTAFYNTGNVRMHNNAQIGFHTNLINNGTFNNNLGLAGFYSNNETRVVSGNQKTSFYNIEIDAVNNLELQTSLILTNELSFISGKVITPRNNTTVSLEFKNHNFYAGEGDYTHIDGYATIIDLNEFTFPIGDDDRLRPMILPQTQKESSFLGAYFFEDPNTPTTFTQNFLTNQKQAFIENVSTIEFWDLNGTSETSITLTWDTFSDIPLITNTINQLRVVGWSIAENKWVDLGNTNVTGDLTQGKITSDSFIPNNYEVITIASGFAENNLTGVNIIFSPNGDNINETLIFDNLEKYKDNHLEIFNRWGITVYKTKNYKNDWTGVSTGRATVKTNSKLPVGTYFYILKYSTDELSKIQKGWIYINR
ncbi:gliding motility-associated C-terminal domain-containing protein [Tenacibaculum aestuariivivum]|uniref:gliding motility-associated C-terminal domain-containing protein n=1 Tax=Tenacibaculum aestuariivivum TaxID=2006131 RepID=UPI003AB229C8